MLIPLTYPIQTNHIVFSMYNAAHPIMMIIPSKNFRHGQPGDATWSPQEFWMSSGVCLAVVGTPHWGRGHCSNRIQQF